MTGIEMMLKSFGFDPEDMKNKVNAFQTDLANCLKAFDEKLNRIEAKTDEVLGLCRSIMTEIESTGETAGNGATLAMLNTMPPDEIIETALKTNGGLRPWPKAK